MKGTSFQKPLEFNLIVEGESWRQGDSISGELKTKNHGTESINWNEIAVHLAYGDLKKIRTRTEGAFKIIASQVATGEVSAWKFQTDLNSPVTDSTSSLFLVYGKGGALETIGQLQVILHPNQVLEDFLKVFEIQHRFIRKSVKHVKGKTEIKFTPPAAKGFVTLELLVLKTSFKGDVLEVEYDFNEKKIEATAVAIEMKKQKKQSTQSFMPSQYRSSIGRFNYEIMEPAIQEMLSSYGKIL